MLIPVTSPDNPRPEKQQDINYKLHVGLSFSCFGYALLV